MEDTYESCVGPNDANLDSFTMMKWIERTHEELNRQLDNLPRKIVLACEKEGFRQETKIIKEAENAARKVKFKFKALFFMRNKYKSCKYLKHFLIMITLYKKIPCVIIPYNYIQGVPKVTIYFIIIGIIKKIMPLSCMFLHKLILEHLSLYNDGSEKE